MHVGMPVNRKVRWSLCHAVFCQVPYFGTCSAVCIVHAHVAIITESQGTAGTDAVAPGAAHEHKRLPRQPSSPLLASLARPTLRWLLLVAPRCTRSVARLTHCQESSLPPALASVWLRRVVLVWLHTVIRSNCAPCQVHMVPALAVVMHTMSRGHSACTLPCLNAVVHLEGWVHRVEQSGTEGHTLSILSLLCLLNETLDPDLPPVFMCNPLAFVMHVPSAMPAALSSSMLCQQGVQQPLSAMH
eukprot:scaffold44649_cov21-Tisochrysis_lutea.AAC.1